MCLELSLEFLRGVSMSTRELRDLWDIVLELTSGGLERAISSDVSGRQWREMLLFVSIGSSNI